jgi:hypothetical protein
VKRYCHIAVRELDGLPDFFVRRKQAKIGREQDRATNITVLTIAIRGAIGKSGIFSGGVFSIQRRKNMVHEKRGETPQQSLTPAQLKQIQEIAETIRYGSITLVFQDGVLIQIDKNEKIRLPKI